MRHLKPVGQAAATTTKSTFCLLAPILPICSTVIRNHKHPPPPPFCPSSPSVVPRDTLIAVMCPRQTGSVRPTENQPGPPAATKRHRPRPSADQTTGPATLRMPMATATPNGMPPMTAQKMPRTPMDHQQRKLEAKVRQPSRIFREDCSSVCGGGGGWYKASVLGCLPLAVPIGLSPLLILTLCGSERVLVVSTEPLDDWMTTPGSAVPETGCCPCR